MSRSPPTSWTATGSPSASGPGAASAPPPRRVPPPRRGSNPSAEKNDRERSKAGAEKPEKTSGSFSRDGRRPAAAASEAGPESPAIAARSASDMSFFKGSAAAVPESGFRFSCGMASISSMGVIPAMASLAKGKL